MPLITSKRMLWFSTEFLQTLVMKLNKTGGRLNWTVNFSLTVWFFYTRSKSALALGQNCICADHNYTSSFTTALYYMHMRPWYRPTLCNLYRQNVSGHPSLAPVVSSLLRSCQYNTVPANRWVASPFVITAGSIIISLSLRGYTATFRNGRV